MDYGPTSICESAKFSLASEETQDTSRPHAPAALSAKAAGDLPVSSTGQALHSNSPLPTTLHVSQDTRLNTEEIDFTQTAIFIPPGRLFFTSGAEAWRCYGCWLQVRASTKTHAANSALPAYSGVYNTLGSKEKKKVPRQLLERNWPQIQTILNRYLLSWITARGALENTCSDLVSPAPQQEPGSSLSRATAAQTRSLLFRVPSKASLSALTLLQEGKFRAQLFYERTHAGMSTRRTGDWAGQAILGLESF